MSNKNDNENNNNNRKNKVQVEPRRPYSRPRSINNWRSRPQKQTVYTRPMIRRTVRWQQNVIKVNQPKNVNNQIINRNNKNTIITGKDLIINCDSNLITTSKIYAAIPISPLYWQGTRIKNMAAQYQYFKPLSLTIEYVPTVSKFQKGTITIGCMSNPFVNDDSIQNTLISSTSGETFSCSEQYVKRIALNSLLQQKKLLLSQTLDKESNPFFIIIYLSDITDNNGFYIAPGTFYFNYKIHLYNPVANPLYYKTENSKMIKDVDLRHQNITGILLTQNNKYTAGTMFKIEKLSNTFNIIINGSRADVDTNKKATLFYSSVPDMLEDKGDVIDLQDWYYADKDKSTALGQNYYFMLIDVEEATIKIYFNRNSSSLEVVIPQGSYYRQMQNISPIMNHPLYIVNIRDTPSLLIETTLPETTTFINFKNQNPNLNYYQSDQELNFSNLQ
jgi:hypothetical protein